MRKLAAVLMTLLMLGSVAAGEEIVFSQPVTVDANMILETPTPTPPPKRVELQWEPSLPHVIRVGERLCLKAVLFNFDDASVAKYTWFVDKHDGNGYQIIAGEHNSSLVLYASREILGCDYRVAVECKQREE